MESNWIENLMLTLAAALTPILVAAITAAAVQLARRFGLDLDAQKQAQVQYYAQLAIREAEEWGARQLANKIQVASGDKLQRAIATLLAKVPGVTPAEAEVLIHGELAVVGAGAVAASLELARAASNEVR